MQKMIRKYWIVLLVLALSSIVWAIGETYLYDTRAQVTDPGRQYSLQDPFVLAGTFDANTATPGVAYRTYATFTTDANNVIAEILPKWNRVRLRVSSTTNNDSTVLDTFLCQSSDDSFTRIGTITWTTGTQTAIASTHEWADTVAETNAHWILSSRVMSPATDGDPNYIAEWSIDVCGSRYIGFSPTTITHAAKVYITGY